MIPPRRPLVLFMALVLCGCAGAQKEKPAAEFPKEYEISQGAPYTILPIDQEYRVRTGDELELRFVNDVSLNATVKVRPDGRITVHPMGDFLVGGKTTAEASGLLAESFSKILKDPRVTVSIRTFAQQYVYVLGEVGSPGGIPYVERMTVLRAIAMVGGPKVSAELNSVIVIEPDEEGRPVGTKVNVSELLREKRFSEDRELKSYAIVFVPKSTIAQVGDFVEMFFKTIDPGVMTYLHAYQVAHPGAAITITR